jgi:hypothetical protein
MTLSPLSVPYIPNGAVGLGVSVTTARGERTDVVWIHQGDFVIEVRNTGPTVDPQLSLSLARSALARLKGALA